MIPLLAFFLASGSLFEWERGIALRYGESPASAMYLWFYEWNLFEAMEQGQHTHGTYRNDRVVRNAGHQAEIRSPALHLSARTVQDGAELTLRVSNLTNYAWPEVAAIIPCWSPGQVEGTNPNSPSPLNANFADPRRENTYFFSPQGLSKLDSRAIHFNHRYRARVLELSPGGSFVFSYKWPTSELDAESGYLIRESEDRQWVTAIGWEDFLSVQGHNPWSCMHASVRVGPLKPNASKTVRGRIYLFRGSRDDCARRSGAWR
jgi:hypothetical protein